MAMLSAAVGATVAALQEREEEEEAERLEREGRQRQQQEQQEQQSQSRAAAAEPTTPPSPAQPPPRRAGRGRGRAGTGDEHVLKAAEGPRSTRRSPSPRSRSPSPPPLLLPRFRELGLVTSLVAGWSAFPSFALLITVILNFTYLRFASFLSLFIEDEEAEPPSAAAVAFLTLRTLSLLFTARNALAMAFDFFVGEFFWVGCLPCLDRLIHWAGPGTDNHPSIGPRTQTPFGSGRS